MQRCWGQGVNLQFLCSHSHSSVNILYRHECFTGKYTTRKIHTKLHTGPEWRIFHILTSEDIYDVISRFVTVVCANSQKWRAVRRAVDSLSSLKLT